MAKRKLVVIGNGMSGVRAVEKVLARGGAEQFDITIFGDETHGNYNRSLLSSVLAGSLDEKDIFVNPPSWYAENGITLRLGSPVTEVDRASREVFARNGVRTYYDILLIATGSKSCMPPMSGMYDDDGKLKAGVFAFRTLNDCREIVRAAQSCRTVAVVGGSVPALEAARGLSKLGCAVHILHRGSYLMDSQLDATGGELLQKSLEAVGPIVHLRKVTTEILGEERVTGIAFGDGGTLDCDMVVVADSIHPNTEIAVRAGLTVARAIIVDNRMRSVDDRNVYAIGECAQFRNKVFGLVTPLWDQARIFAEQMTGRDASSMSVGNNGVAATEIGQPNAPAYHIYSKLLVRDGRLLGGIPLGDVGEAAHFMRAFDEDSPSSPDRTALLFEFGAPPQKVMLNEVPAHTHICNCMGVSKAAIDACVASGKSSMQAVMESTRAGTGCSACTGLIGDLVAWFRNGKLDHYSSVQY